MLDSLCSHPLWQLVMQIDMVSMIILFLLVLMSFCSWSIFFYKLVLFYVKNRHMKSMNLIVQQTGTWEELVRMASVCPETMPGYFLTHNVEYVASLIAIHKQIGNLTVDHWQQLQEVMYHKIDDIIYREEEVLWVLSTSAGSATLLGLFGTVWGLVHAFLNISHKQAADIVVVAPGIAQALMTTLVGLIVAIPALIMFNYLQARVRHLEQQLLSLAHRFNAIIQAKFI